MSQYYATYKRNNIEYRCMFTNLHEYIKTIYYHVFVLNETISNLTIERIL